MALFPFPGVGKLSGMIHDSITMSEKSAYPLVEEASSPGVTHAISRLDSRLANLDRTLATHADRLSGVLRPAEPAPPVGALVDGVRQPASPIAENLLKFVDILDQMIAFVDELTLRVDA